MIAPTNVPALILDTNVTLDWLVFADPRTTRLPAMLAEGGVRWISCDAMRAELGRIVVHERLAIWNADPGHVLAQHDRWSHRAPPPPATPAAWRCDDPDDQIFIDLALHARARWLLTRDLALLRLARRANTVGLTIVEPQGWDR